MKNVFIHTTNVKNFAAAMQDAAKITAEPVLLIVYGEAGCGKTETARFFAAQENWVLARYLKGWKSELWMLQDLCFEFKIDPIPFRKKPAFEAIIETLREEPRPVLIDEADKLSWDLLEWVRDLADKTFVPFVLLGETGLIHKIKRERRLWRRTVRAIEFTPVNTTDILFYVKEASGLNITADQAETLRQASGGDLGLVARDIRHLEEIVQVNKIEKISDDTVKTAIKQGLRDK